MAAYISERSGVPQTDLSGEDAVRGPSGAYPSDADLSGAGPRRTVTRTSHPLDKGVIGSPDGSHTTWLRDGWLSIRVEKAGLMRLARIGPERQSPRSHGAGLRRSGCCPRRSAVVEVVERRTDRQAMEVAQRWAAPTCRAASVGKSSPATCLTVLALPEPHDRQRGGLVRHTEMELADSADSTADEADRVKASPAWVTLSASARIAAGMGDGWR